MRAFIVCLTVGAAGVLAAPPSAPDNAPAKDDVYPIYEHGEGRWFSFDAPVEVRHKLETRALTDYRLELKVSVLTRDGKQAKAQLGLAARGTFGPTLRPALPETSHADLVLDERAVAELPLTVSASTNDGDKVLTWHYSATVPLTVFRKMAAAKAVRGCAYWRTENEVVEKVELRSFTLDAKAVRTLAALDAKTR